MRRWAGLVLSLLMALSLCACSEPAVNDSGSVSEQVQDSSAVMAEDSLKIHGKADMAGLRGNEKKELNLTLVDNETLTVRAVKLYWNFGLWIDFEFVNKTDQKLSVSALDSSFYIGNRVTQGLLQASLESGATVNQSLVLYDVKLEEEHINAIPSVSFRLDVCDEAGNGLYETDLLTVPVWNGAVMEEYEPDGNVIYEDDRVRILYLGVDYDPRDPNTRFSFICYAENTGDEFVNVRCESVSVGDGQTSPVSVPLPVGYEGMFGIMVNGCSTEADTDGTVEFGEVHLRMTFRDEVGNSMGSGGMSFDAGTVQMEVDGR